MKGTKLQWINIINNTIKNNHNHNNKNVSCLTEETKSKHAGCLLVHYLHTFCCKAQLSLIVARVWNERKFSFTIVMKIELVLFLISILWMILCTVTWPCVPWKPELTQLWISPSQLPKSYVIWPLADLFTQWARLPGVVWANPMHARTTLSHLTGEFTCIYKFILFHVQGSLSLNQAFSAVM